MADRYGVSRWGAWISSCQKEIKVPPVGRELMTVGDGKRRAPALNWLSSNQITERTPQP